MRHYYCYPLSLLPRPQLLCSFTYPSTTFRSCGVSTGTLTVCYECYTHSLDGKPYLQITYDYNSYITFSLVHNYTTSSSTTEANLSVFSNKNTNLTPSKKFLLLLHQNFGDRSMQSIQHMFFHVHPFTSTKFTGAAKYEMPKCDTYECLKDHRHPTKGSTPISRPDTYGSPKALYTRLGARISVNHFKYRL